MGLLFVGIPAWMAVNNKTPTEIGSVAFACALPWTFKFVVAPLMDRYTLLPMGRKRPWVIAAQIGLVASLILLAYVPNPLSNLKAFMGAIFVVSMFGAIQDGATDGMAVDIVPAAEQARTNGFMGGARMIGSSISLALTSWLMNVYNFTVATLVLAIVIGLITLVPICLREQQGEKVLPWTSGAASTEGEKMQLTSWKTILTSLYNLFRLKNSLLVCLLMFVTMGAYNYFETLLPLFTVKVSGWTNISYSRAFATADLIGGVSGIILGGYLIERFGKKRMIGIYLLLIILVTTSLAFLKPFWTSSSFIYGFIIIYRWLNAFAKIGVYAIAMECCSKTVSASQFTFYMTIGAVGSMVGATLIGPIKERFSWEITFCIFAVMLVIACFIVGLLNINKHVRQITALEERKLLEVAA
jgi:PAT family beta-lactamase induction signal transducer AmpG